MIQSLNSWLLTLPPGVVYILILAFTGIIYQQAFAHRLPLLKSLIIYLVLGAGCLLLLLFHFMKFPMIPILFFTVVMIIVTKWRLRYSQMKEK